MQIGIEGASGRGAARPPGAEAVNGVATDEDGDPLASVYEPADAIAGAAKYLIAHGVQQNVPAAIFAYNHADWYVQEVLSWASTYAAGGFTVSEVTPNGDGTGRRGRRRQHHLHRGQPAGLVRRAQRDRADRDQLRRGRNSASRTCSAAPGRPRSTARAWS